MSESKTSNSLKAETIVQAGTIPAQSDMFIQITEAGPYLVHGEPAVMQKIIEVDAKGASSSFRVGKTFPMSGVVALCRCGHSKNSPYCDGSHLNANVDLQETASFEPLLENSELTRGVDYTLADNDKYCCFGRFCDAGERVWNEVLIEGAEAKQSTLHMVHNCPGGRLLVWDNQDKKPIEIQLDPSIGLIEDPKQACSGPLAVWGGIRVESSSGKSYEVRTRQALCRCGQSSNKPFCDGTHASFKYKDGID